MDVCIYAHDYLFALLLRALAFSKRRIFFRDNKKKKQITLIDVTNAKCYVYKTIFVVYMRII